MEDALGVEPRTYGLKGRCSTTELSVHWWPRMESNHESPRYERGALPLS